MVDEAYAPFTDASFLPALDQHENLMVMRTLSKLGLAGLRLGYIAGHPRLIDQINKIRLPYNINVLTQVAAEFALTHGDFLNQQTRILKQQRTWLNEKLSTMPGLTVYPSDANFILLKTSKGRASELHGQLKEPCILIKNLSPQGGSLIDCLRITVGTPEENERLVKTLELCLIYNN